MTKAEPILLMEVIKVKEYVKPEMTQVTMTSEESIAKVGSVCVETGTCEFPTWDFSPVTGQ